MTVTLMVGIIMAGATFGNTSMNTTTRAYPDIGSCVAALQQALTETSARPGVISVSATCTVLKAP